MYTAAIERYEWNKLQGEKLINYSRAVYKHLKVFSFVTHVSLGVVQLGISCIKYILGY